MAQLHRFSVITIHTANVCTVILEVDSYALNYREFSLNLSWAPGMRERAALYYSSKSRLMILSISLMQWMTTDCSALHGCGGMSYSEREEIEKRQNK